MAAQDKPPSCLRQGRVRGRTGQAAFLPTARAGAWPHGTSRFLAYGKGGCVAARDRPPSCLRQGRVRGRTGQAAFLPTARAGAWPHGTGRPLACGKGGGLVSAARRKHAGVYGRPTLSARLAAGKSCPFLELAAGEASPAPPGRGLCPLPSPLKGALPPRPPNGGKCPPYPPLTSRVAPAGQAALLPAARAGDSFLQLGGNTRACMGDPHCLLAWRRGKVVRSWNSLRGRLPPRPPGGGCAPFQPS